MSRCSENCLVSYCFQIHNTASYELYENLIMGIFRDICWQSGITQHNANFTLYNFRWNIERVFWGHWRLSLLSLKHFIDDANTLLQVFITPTYKRLAELWTFMKEVYKVHLPFIFIFSRNFQTSRLLLIMSWNVLNVLNISTSFG